METNPTDLNSNTLYTIGEAADILGISIQSLRLYEKEGLILPIRRSSRHRRYTKDDLDRIRSLRKIINVDKVGLEGVKKILATIPCWTITDCPPEHRDSCPAFLHQEKPCWLEAGKAWECRYTDCRTCEVYVKYAACDTLQELTESRSQVPQLG